jgi:hypothetical protein
MNTYLIGYDLRKPGQDYSALFDAIKGLTGTWWHHLDSTWVIRHPGSAVDIRDALTPHLDSNDELLVVQLSGEGAWYGFNNRGSDWLPGNI